MKLTAPESVGMSSQRLNLIRGYLDRYISNDKLTGGMVLVARHGEPVWLEPQGLMDREARARLARTVFTAFTQ